MPLLLGAACGGATEPLRGPTALAVTGRITDAARSPLAGATLTIAARRRDGFVHCLDTTPFTVVTVTTDADGRVAFRLEGPSGAAFFACAEVEVSPPPGRAASLVQISAVGLQFVPLGGAPLDTLRVDAALPASRTY